jgi:hypothetical protein
MKIVFKRNGNIERDGNYIGSIRMTPQGMFEAFFDTGGKYYTFVKADTRQGLKKLIESELSNR